VSGYKMGNECDTGFNHKLQTVIVDCITAPFLSVHERASLKMSIREPNSLENTVQISFHFTAIMQAADGRKTKESH
jgi:uncharacterized UPF0146 family protein